MRAATNALAVCVLVACNQKEASSPAPAPATAPAERNPSSQSPSERAIRATAAGPAAVVNLVLEWDTAGLRFDERHAEALGRVNCYILEEDCLSTEPGWDMITAVRGYEVQAIHEDADSAVYAIRFDEIGTLSGETMKATSGTQPDTLWLKRINGMWRIVSVESQMGPHLSPTAAFRMQAGLVSDTAKLAAWLGLHR